MSQSAKEWSNAQNALAYLNVSDSLPHRSEGEAVLIEHIPKDTNRILDLGTGDGRLIRLIKKNRPDPTILNHIYFTSLINSIIW